MNSATAQKVVLTSAILTFGLGYFNKAKDGKFPSAKFLIGSTITFIGLSFVADFEPQVGSALSLAVVTTAFFSEGNGILEYMNQGEMNSAPSPTKKTPVRPVPRVVYPPAQVGQIPGALAHPLQPTPAP